MSSWTNKDEAAGAPLWAVAYIKKTPSSANRTDLFGDTTADGGRSGRIQFETLVALTNSADA